jgi:hypothetical protein
MVKLSNPQEREVLKFKSSPAKGLLVDWAGGQGFDPSEMRCAPVKSASLIPLGYFTRQADASGIFHGVDAAVHVLVHVGAAEGQEEVEFAGETRFDGVKSRHCLKTEPHLKHEPLRRPG